MHLRQAYQAVLTKVAIGLSHVQWHSTFLGLPARSIVSGFRAAKAVNPHSIQRFHPASVWEEAAFLRLVQLAIIREPEPGRYFLDEARLDALNGTSFFE